MNVSHVEAVVHDPLRDEPHVLLVHLRNALQSELTSGPRIREPHGGRHVLERVHTGNLSILRHGGDPVLDMLSHLLVHLSVVRGKNETPTSLDPPDAKSQIQRSARRHCKNMLDVARQPKPHLKYQLQDPFVLEKSLA